MREKCLESFNYQGEWWLPENPDRREKGDIRFSQEDGIELCLNGSFRDFDISKAMMLGEKTEIYPTILGISAQGNKEFTLVDCFESRFDGSFSGYPTQKCRAGMALIGGQIKDFKQEKYTKVFVQLTHLPEWAGFSGFSIGFPSDEEQGERTWHLDYSSPEEVVSDTDFGKVVFFCLKQPPRTHKSFSEVILSQSTYVRVEPAEPMLYEDLQKQFIQPIQRLLTLATCKPNYVVSISLTPEATETDGEYETIGVFYNQSLKTPSIDENIHPRDMLFTLADIADDLNNVVNSWLRLHTELGPVCDLFFSVQFASHMYLEGRFLNMVHAAETYHRRCNKPSSEEPVLRKRLGDLLDETGEAVGPLIPNRKDFVDKVVDTRNYLTHYDPKKEKKAAKRLELYKLTETLSYVVQVCLLTESGISTKRCAELLSKNPSFQQFHKTQELL